MKNNYSRAFPAVVGAILFTAFLATASAQWKQTATLLASDGQRGDGFGLSIAVSGHTMVIGAIGRNTFTGLAYVFTESNGVWTQVAELTASDAIQGIDFGRSVAIDGDTIVAGANAEFTGNTNGAAYVFVKPSTGWTNMTETAKLTASDEEQFDLFGNSVAISGDTIAVGARNHPFSGSKSGAAYVFVRPSTGWTSMTQTAELTPSDGKHDSLGDSLALQGSTLVAGASVAVGGGNGAAYVFVKPSNGWTNGNETAVLTATDEGFLASLGISVAVSGDESTIVAGSEQATAYLYSKPTTGWQTTTQTAEMFFPKPALDYGFPVAMNSSGTVVVVGAQETISHATNGVGDAYVYLRPAGGWPPTTTANVRLNPPVPLLNGFFGSALAVRGLNVFVGQYGANGNQGAVYSFTRQ